MVAVGGRTRDVAFRGLEQFSARGNVGGLGYCIASASPYALEFSNDDDVICLLLGDIATETKFDDDTQQSFVFEGQSSAFHPRGSNVRVHASTVRNGFMAFSYARSYLQILDDADVGRIRNSGSRNNVRRDNIRCLSLYTLGRLRGGKPLSALEIQSIGSLVYLETMRSLGIASDDDRTGLSSSQFSAICDHIEEEMGHEVSCASLAAAAGVPLRVVFDGIRKRTGMSPYQFVMVKRIGRALDLLQNSNIPIAEIALICGFSSQQHLTSSLTNRVGSSPAKVRMDR